MTVEVVLAIAGVVALLTGILGGGIKAKEVEIPSIRTSIRVASTVVGVILIALSIWKPGNVSPSNSSASIDATIFADRSWQDSGVDIGTGNTVSIKYLEGTWQIDPTYQAVDATGYFDQSYDGIVQDATIGALLAHVGNGKPFLVGTSISFTATDSGRLYLRVNDGLLSDNSGSVKVQINVGR